MDGPREGPSETDGAHLARTKAPSETDGAPLEMTPSTKNTEYKVRAPRQGPSQRDGEEPHAWLARGTIGDRWSALGENQGAI